ncbi:MAG: DMT family transporter [Candidatus Sumerlaeaceae bacterium]|nr:DMT family transporter [Candidatus Sumerlaeaceae bacterium]
MPLSVYARILLATFLWGTAFPLIKVGLHHAPPLGFAGLRFLLAGGLLLTASAAVRSRLGGGDTPVTRPADWPRILMIACLSTAVFYAMFFLGMARTTASTGALLDAASPIIGSVMAHFVLHNDRLTRRKIAAIIIAFAGIAIIALGRSGSGPQDSSLVGCALILGGLVISSAGTMLVITYRGRFGLMRLTGTQQAIGGALLLIMSALVEGRHHWHNLLSGRFLAVLLWLAFVSATAFRIWYGLVRHYKVTSISVYWFLTGLWGAFLSVAFLGEPVRLHLAAGFVLVVAGLLLMFGHRSGHERDWPRQSGVVAGGQ